MENEKTHRHDTSRFMKMHLSIRSKFLFYMLVPTVVILLLWSVVSYRTIENSYQNAVANLFFEILDSATQRTKLFITKEIDKLEILGMNPIVQAYVENSLEKYIGKKTQGELTTYFNEMDRVWSDGSRSDVIDSVLTNMASQVLRDFRIYEKLRYREMYVTDKFGGLVAATSKTDDFFQGDETWWDLAFRTGGKTYVGDIEYDESSQTHSIALGIPIRKRSNEKIIGVMKVILDVDELFALGSEFHVGKTGVVRVFNAEGDIIFDFHREFIQTREDPLILKRVAVEKQGFLKVASDGIEQFVVFRSVDLGKLLGEKMVTKNQWNYCLSQHVSETFEPLRKSQRFQLLRISLFTFVLLLGSFYLARHVTKPIAQLVRHTREIAAGNLNKKIEMRSNDEFGELGEAFNRMVERLERYFQLTEASERRYKTLFESSGEGIVVFEETTGVIVNANQAIADLVGRDKKQLIGRKMDGVLKEILPLDVAEESLRVMLGASDSRAVTLFTGDGKKRIFEVSPNSFELDKKRFVQCFFHDVTEEKQIEGLKNNLIRDVAHELRTPVAKFHISLDLLRSELEKYAPLDNRIHLLSEILKKSIDRLSQTIESILDFSRLQEGVVYLDRQKFLFAGLLEEVENEYLDLAREKGLKLRIEEPRGPIMIQGDRRLLKMAMGNLVSNAIKFTSYGEVMVKCIQEGGRVQVWVQDNGIGISAENLPQIFDKFFQVSPSVPGCGVGLAICDEIVKLHGGKIWAESMGLGKGSTFKLELITASG